MGSSFFLGASFLAIAGIFIFSSAFLGAATSTLLAMGACSFTKAAAYAATTFTGAAYAATASFLCAAFCYLAGAGAALTSCFLGCLAVAPFQTAAGGCYSSGFCSSSLALKKRQEATTKTKAIDRYQ